MFVHHLHFFFRNRSDRWLDSRGGDELEQVIDGRLGDLVLRFEHFGGTTNSRLFHDDEFVEGDGGCSLTRRLTGRFARGASIGSTTSGSRSFFFNIVLLGW